MDRNRTPCLVFLGSFLSSILLFECRKLDGYKFPVYTTKFCPKDKPEWDSRSSFANCREGSSYACLPNENITELLEFCYPQEVISIHEDICLFLRKSSSKVDFYDCIHFEYGCPTGFYTGDTIYNYPSCVSIGNGCFLAEPTCKSKTVTTEPMDVTTGHLDTTVTQERSATQQTDEEEPTDSNETKLVWIPVVSGVVFLLVFALICGIVLYIHRRKKSHGANSDPESQEEAKTALLQDAEQKTSLLQEGFDKSTVSRTIKRVTEALVAKADTFIQWPDATTKSSIKTGFYRLAGFPNVVGCIDGTHVRIQAPPHDENSFVNRKGYHSINVQAVCDHDGKVTNINASWPGSVHDSHIFRTSQIRTYLEEEENGLFENGVLLGDSGYACRPFLLTPYANPQTEPEEKYNQAHARTRSEIERTFGRLKRRFHVLHSEIRMKPDRACRIIIACAVLHNIAINLGEPEDDDEVEEDQPQVPAFQGQQDGRGVRDYVTQHYFS